VSSELRANLKKVVEEDYESDERQIEEDVERFKSLLTKIAKAGKWDLTVWLEGTEFKDLKKYEHDLSLLERANLIKGQMKYTERNAYREYRPTKKGTELAKKLSNET
jgi:hypothetical protein